MMMAASTTILGVEITQEIANWLPRVTDLSPLTAGSDGIDCGDDLRVTILDPLREFLGRSSKQIRAQIVHAALDMACGGTSPSPAQKSLAGCLSQVVEALHAGSLIIDDIQDASDKRRGLPALHVQIGEPLAINAANWLYFWPGELIRKQNLSASVEVEIYRVYHDTMIRAHYGQALDLGFDMTAVAKDRARPVSMAAIAMKTGALMGMCCEFGAIAADADADTRSTLTQFGQTFGTVLQMFNDIGEVRATSSSLSPFSRPSWVWTVAADTLSAREYEEFRKLMSGSGGLPGREKLAAHPVVDEAARRARGEMGSCLDGVSGFAGKTGTGFVEKIARKVMEAYA